MFFIYVRSGVTLVISLHRVFVNDSIRDFTICFDCFHFLSIFKVLVVDGGLHLTM